MPDWVGTVLEVIGALGGGSVIVGGLAWLLARKMLERDRARHQRELEAFKHEGSTLLESQRQAGARGLFVHEKQFEKEFAEYCLVWPKFMDVQDAAGELRGWAMYRCKRDEDVEKQSEARERFLTVTRAAEDMVRRARPFYSPEVFEAAWDALNSLWKVGQHVAPLVEYDGQHAKEIRDAFHEAHRKLTAVSDMIQKVIWSRSSEGRSLMLEENNPDA